MYLRSRAMGVENRLKGVNVALAPVAGGLGRFEPGRLNLIFPGELTCANNIGHRLRVVTGRRLVRIRT